MENFPTIASKSVESEKTELEVDYKMIRFKECLEDPEMVEKHFERQELDEQMKLTVEECFEEMIGNPEHFVGSGNNAIVLSLHNDREQCAKCCWDFISVENKSKNKSKLPDHARNLRKIQDYFGEIKSKRRGLMEKGFIFEAQNRPLQEAIITNYAHSVLEHEGFKDSVPYIYYLITREHSEDGECGPKDPYMISETMNMMTMTEINGRTVEQFILESTPDTVSQIDVKKISEKLNMMIDKLNEYGVYHNDISTRNIMIDNTTGEPWLIDFGTGEFTREPSDERYKKNKDQLETVLKLLTTYQEDPVKTKQLHMSRINDL